VTRAPEPERFTSNTAEAQFAQWAAAEGWQVTKRGWPDFICRRGVERMAVEVKHTDDLSGPQRSAIIDLSAGPVPCYVWRPPSPRRPQRGQLEEACKVRRVMSERRQSEFQIAATFADLLAEAEGKAATLAQQLEQRDETIRTLRAQLKAQELARSRARRVEHHAAAPLGDALETADVLVAERAPALPGRGAGAAAESDQHAVRQEPAFRVTASTEDVAVGTLW
jgi:hypothetical protein